MALISISTALIEEALFGIYFPPVKVEGVERADNSTVVFKISGPDIPAGDVEVKAVCKVEMGADGRQIIHLTFETCE